MVWGSRSLVRQLKVPPQYLSMVLRVSWFTPPLAGGPVRQLVTPARCWPQLLLTGILTASFWQPFELGLVRKDPVWARKLVAGRDICDENIICFCEHPVYLEAVCVRALGPGYSTITLLPPNASLTWMFKREGFIWLFFFINKRTHTL